MLKTWKDKFIPTGIIDSIVHYNTNPDKREDYITDLNNNNFENDFNATRAGISIERDHINNGYIYNNMND